MRIACTVQYDGAAYAGFQLQKNGRTVQEDLEIALGTLTRATERVRVWCCGRTDAGVHSFGQVIHFQLADPPAAGLDKFIYSFNCILPPQVSIVHAAEVPENFHARFSCTGREYIYQVCNTPYRMAQYARTSLWIRHPLDLAAMREAVEPLIGEHDFAAYTRSVYSRNGESTVRRIDGIDILRNGPLVILHFRGSGFLHNMIRIMTGTLIKVGKGEYTCAAPKDILEGRKREDAGMTLPPQGLFFFRAHYLEYATPENALPLYLTECLKSG